jgi:hypothetical protein
MNAPKVFSVVMASSSTYTSAVELGVGWDNIWLEVPSMTSNTTMYVVGSRASNTTFYRLACDPITSMSIAADFQINSARNNYVRLPGGMPYLKVEVASLQTDVTKTFYFVCS